MSHKEQSVVDRATELWRSGRQVWVMVGDETSRYQRGIIQAVQGLNAREIERARASGEDVRRLHLVFHDRWNGFYPFSPRPEPCRDKSNILGNALQMALMSREQIDKHPTFGGIFNPATEDAPIPPFDPADDVVFVFSSFDQELKDQPVTLTLLRDVMQFNMCSRDYVRQNQLGRRGQRMLVFITPTNDLPTAIPELKGEVIPLPNSEELKEIALSVLEPEWEAHEANPQAGLARLDDPQLETLINSMHGMTAADAEEAVALAVTRHHDNWSFDDVLETIENEKVKALAKIPGVQAIPKSKVIDQALPGYEKLVTWVGHRMSLSEEQLRRHSLSRLKGVALAGPPGCGKTVFGKYFARLTNRGLLLWNIGESKGSKVGETEQNTRRVIQAARAGRYCVLADDIDKGGFASAGSGYSGDGGTSENQIQMVLTEMSDAFSDIVWVLTCNRVQNLPAELLRKGRMDELFKLVKPNAATRRAILDFHIARFSARVQDTERDSEPDSEVNGVSQLDRLADEHMKDWLPVEIMSLVKDEVTATVAQGKEFLDVERMIEQARGTVPMCRQKVFQEDIQAMEEACSQFIPLGNVPEPEGKSQAPVATAGTGRARRRVSPN